MTHGERAKALFLEGYNCSQAVAGAFCEEMGMDLETVAKMSSSFGGGLARLREVCGCVSGMALAAGAIYGYSDPKAGKEKTAHYERIQKLAAKFREESGSIICRELLAGINNDTRPVPEERTEQYYKKRPCPELAALAAEILERELQNFEKEQ
ncbi:C-GCAxxG-C-C family protein [Lachnospiraceae bacterium 62-35]